jgi:hypothetical protein
LINPRPRSVSLARWKVDALDHGIERNDVRLIAHPDRKPLDDGQCQRKADGDGGPRPASTLDGDRAAEPVDVTAHHVHPDPSSGQIRHRLGRRKSRLEDQPVHVVARQVLPVGEQALGSGFLDDFPLIQPRAVVRYLDDDVARFAEGAQGDVSRGILPGLFAPIRRLDPVIERVADHV